jgi:hypothetical protein
MRTPTRSFKDELDTYSQLITPTSDRPDLAAHWKYRLVTEVLDRWREHLDVERLWQDVSAKLPAEIPAGIFIGAVVLERVKLEEVALRLPDTPDTITAAKADRRRRLKVGQYDVASSEAQLIDNLKSVRQSFSRKTDGAVEGRFMVFLQAWFENKCGRPFRKHVATLTDIAFGGEHHVDAVRDAMRRQRGRP